MKMLTKWQYDHKVYAGSINTGISMTVPDQTMSVRTIMDKYARGLNLEQRIGFYDEDSEDIVDLKHMDLADRQEYIEQKQQELLQLTQNEEVRKKAALKMKLDKKAATERSELEAKIRAELDGSKKALIPS